MKERERGNEGDFFATKGAIILKSVYKEATPWGRNGTQMTKWKPVPQDNARKTGTNGALAEALVDGGGGKPCKKRFLVKLAENPTERSGRRRGEAELTKERRKCGPTNPKKEAGRKANHRPASPIALEQGRIKNDVKTGEEGKKTKSITQPQKKIGEVGKQEERGVFQPWVKKKKGFRRKGSPQGGQNQKRKERRVGGCSRGKGKGNIRSKGATEARRRPR